MAVWCLERLRRAGRALGSWALLRHVCRAWFARLVALSRPRAERSRLRYRLLYGDDRRLVQTNYRLQHGQSPDLAAPRTYCEKLSVLKLTHDNPLVRFCSDKISVRRYVAWKGLAELLVPILASYERAADFSPEGLPERFVAKANHGSGWVLFCRDPCRFRPAAARRRFARWLAEDYSYLLGETNYRDIPPRIIVEPLIEAEGGLVEFKFFCFHGEAKFVSVISAREDGRPVRGIYEADWRKVDYGSRGLKLDPEVLPEPAYFERLKAQAETLAADFLHVRVDFMAAGERIYFSELTFYNLGGFVPLEPLAMNEVVGGWLDLSQAPAYAERGRAVLAALEAAQEAESPDAPVLSP